MMQIFRLVECMSATVGAFPPPTVFDGGIMFIPN